MSRVTILEFSIDEENAAKFAAHGVTLRQVDQVLGNNYVIVPNRKGRRAKYLVIGRDDGGACIAIPVTPTHDRTVWRPVTAWFCKDSEKALLQRKEK